MRQLYLSDVEHREYPLVFLVSTIRKDEVLKEYITPFEIPKDDVLFFDLHYSQVKKKTPAAEIKEYITSELVPALDDVKAQYVVVTDSEYFKVLAKVDKVDVNLGYVMDSPFGSWKVVYVPSYRAVFYDPEKVRGKIAQGMNAMLSHAAGSYEAPGNNIIGFAEYPETYDEIKAWLDKLLAMDCDLTSDIEAFDLKHHKAGIGTITLCWNKSEGIAFAVDYQPIPGATSAPYGKFVKNEPIRELLRQFFKKYLKRMIWHNISYDVYVLIYQLYMTDLIDTAGIEEGMNILLANWEDTKLITYLATNSCAGNELSLKDQAQEFAGNYAQTEIKDITKIPLPTLLEYNLVDGLGTWFTYEKHWQTMIDDDQMGIYQEIFKPATVDIIQMQLTGMPLNHKQVLKVERILTTILDNAVDAMRASTLIQEYEYLRLEKFTELKNSEWKTKRLTVQEMFEAAKTSKAFKKEISFNPNSGPQLQEILFDILQLPVISYTKNKQPSVDGDTFAALANRELEPKVKEFIAAMIDYSAVSTILTSFIPAMRDAPMGPDGWHYLFGNFNLGGTLSGRLSSSNINLQNLPANVFMALSAILMQLLGDEVKPYIKKGKLSLGKLIKSCFQAPPGWLFVGLDFASLEDRISALTTKDPNKLKVYTDGYDGHCLRAYTYFGENMPDIDPTSVASINSIEKLYPLYRQDSKAPTFALTYQGTFATLMKNCGFDMEKAKLVEFRYNELYKVSIDWVQGKLDEASKCGYVTAAFGLRVRTPLLKQVIRNNSKTPQEAQAEGRSAGNALGQSWCLLNSRAGSEFMGKVRKSQHKFDIRPCSQIHDAQYFMVRDEIEPVMYTNEHLVKAVQWQEHPDIAHDEVKLGGELSIFWPDWSNEIGIPNYATEEEVHSSIQNSFK